MTADTATGGVAARAAGAHVVTATAKSPTTPEALVVTATLARPGSGDDEARLLRLIATSAVQAIDRLGQARDAVTPA